LFVAFALNEADPTSGAGTRKASSRLGKSANFITVAGQYRDQLNNLLETLGSTYPHFIQCIITNHKQQPLVIEDSIVLDQLRCNGVLKIEGYQNFPYGLPQLSEIRHFPKKDVVLY
jgi:myosin heavy subunit